MELRSDVITPDKINSIQWSGNIVPRDGPLRSRSYRYLPVSATAVMTTLSFVGFVAAILFIAFNVKFSKLQYIKLSSPNMNNVVAVGCSLGYISVVLFSLDGRHLYSHALGPMCHARLFVLCAAYSLALGAIFFKTWRVHRIMANKKLEKIKLKDWHLLAWILGLVALDVLFLCAWVLTDPLTPTITNLQHERDPLDDDHIVTPYIEECSCLYEGYWMGAMIAYKGVLLLFGLLLAWETRQIQVQALNDSKYIGMSVYNLSIMCVVGVPVGFLIDDEYFVGNYVISSIFIIMAVTVTLCFVFVPKLYAIYHNPTGEVDMRFPGAQTTMGTSGPSSLTTCTSRVGPMKQTAQNIAIQHKLEKMVAERDSRITELEKELMMTKSLSSDSAIAVQSVA